MNTTLERYAQALQERVAQNTLRSLRPSRTHSAGMIELNGKPLVNFASNDYLGLSQHKVLIERSKLFAERYGVGNGASRLLGGNLEVFEDIENKLARLKGSEAALILPSGFQANSSVIPTILAKDSVAAADRLVHRSLIEGLLLSSARWFRFKHNDFGDLKERLENRNSLDGLVGPAGSRCSQGDSQGSSQGGSQGWVISESVFSMDGDRLDVQEAVRLAESLGLSLYIDEAHATGVLGEQGMGLTAGLSIPGISMGTFGKGLGSFGAYICCSSLMREYLINFCPGLIYSTALPPPVLGAIDAALDVVPEMGDERALLQENAQYMRASLQSLGFETGASSTQIIPIILGSAESSLALSSYLEESGFYVPAIRPPTVPEGSARLRVSLSAVHTKDQIDNFLKLLRKWHEKKN